MSLMNKKIMTVAVAASLFSFSIGAQAAGDSVTVNVSGAVVDNTCTPSWNTSGVSVDLGRVSLKDFGSDKVGATKSFTLSLADCGSGATGVTVTTTGDQDTTDNTLFKNSVAGGATNVGVGVWGDSSQSTQLKPDGSNSVSYTIADKKVDMAFLAKLMQSGATAPGTGEVKSAITMTVNYQ